MCGILGSVPSEKQRKFSFALSQLTHRGPDGQGSWHHEENKASLGATRLAIYDLSERASQPYCYAHLRIVYNGALYNHPELRSTLKGLGHRFTDDSDTAVIAAAYLEWGTACFLRFNGMWALAIYDERDDSLLLCRDRFAQKPLYYQHNSSQFRFASEMKALVPLMEKLELHQNIQAFADDCFGYESGEDCLIQGIKRFPAGHYGLFKNGTFTLTQWWNTLDHLTEPPKNYSDQVEAFRELFFDACSLRLRADVPVASTLSGGVDSSAVVGAAARLKGQDVNAHQAYTAFIAGFAGTPLDEQKYAEQVVSHTGLESQTFEIDAKKGLEQLPEALFKFEEFYITSPVPMLQTYANMKAKGFAVSLDGHGADELFSGYDTFIFHAFLDCGLNPNAISGILKAYRGLVEPGQHQFVQQKVSFRNYLQWVTHYRNIGALKGHFSKEIEKAFAKPLPHFNGGTEPKSTSDLGALNGALYDLFHRDNLPVLLRNYDRYSMMSGVEVRTPFLDHRLVSFCFSLPWTSKLSGGYTKRILRDAMAPFLPREVIYRRSKMGFQTPIVDWLKGPWKSFVHDILSSRFFKRSELIDPEKVAGQIKQLLADEQATYRMGELAYAALQPCLWQEFVYKRFADLNRAGKEFD